MEALKCENILCKFIANLRHGTTRNWQMVRYDNLIKLYHGKIGRTVLNTGNGICEVVLIRTVNNNDFLIIPIDLDHVRVAVRHKGGHMMALRDISIINTDSYDLFTEVYDFVENTAIMGSDYNIFN